MLISKWLNYCTIFGGTINDMPVWGENRIREDACYRNALFKMTNRQAPYHSILSIKICNNARLCDRNRNNYCFLSKKELYNYLKQLTKLYPFIYSVQNGIYRGIKCYVVTVDMVATRAISTVILQSIKKLYEFPQNFYLSEAYKMQHLPQFRFDNIQNLFMAVASCYEDYGYRDHVFGVSRKFMTISQMREKLPHIAYACQLYEDWRQEYHLKSLTLPEYDTDLIFNDGYFEKHIKYYTANYHRLKTR